VATALDGFHDIFPGQAARRNVPTTGLLLVPRTAGRRTGRHPMSKKQTKLSKRLKKLSKNPQKLTKKMRKVLA
jgi:hypothetical protein